MFVEKLNKKQEGVYVIEEEKDITDGKWEGYLDHDNVNRESIVIYTGPFQSLIGRLKTLCISSRK